MNNNGIGRAARRRASREARKAARSEQQSTHTTMWVPETEIQAAAIHEAAHVLAGFHWCVPIGENGVSLTPGKYDVAGFSDMRWSQLPGNWETVYASHVATLIAPFAEYRYRNNCMGDDFDWERLISSARLDFAQIASITTPNHSPNSVSLDAQMNFGRLCFLIWFDHEPKEFARRSTAETVAHFRNLVADSDLMLQAYWKQIVKFTDVLLSAVSLRLSAVDVNNWRDGHFKRCSVNLSTHDELG